MSMDFLRRAGSVAAFAVLSLAVAMPLPASADEEINEVIVNNIVQWWGDPVNRKLVKRLRKAGVNFNSALLQSA